MVGMDPADAAYPTSRTAIREKIAEYRIALDELKARPVAIATFFRATTRSQKIVEGAIQASFPADAPLPYTEIVGAKLVPRNGRVPDGAHAELVMFDGKSARFEAIGAHFGSLRERRRTRAHLARPRVRRRPSDHPLVAMAEAALGKRLEAWKRGSLCRHWATKANWRHAMDLATDEHHQALIDTQHLTTVSDIDSAVSMNLASPDHRRGRKPVLSIANARRVLDEAGLGIEDHARSMELIYGEGLHVSPGAEYHPRIRLGVAWMVIHGLEDGLLVREWDGFNRLSPALAAARAPMWPRAGASAQPQRNAA